MRYERSLALFLSLVLLSPSPPVAQGDEGKGRGGAKAPDAKPDLEANAALKYWWAFAALPTLDKGQEKLLREWNKVPLDAAALKLIDRSRLSRLDLHRAAKLRHCDWSLDYEDGIRMRVPYLPKSLTLARLTALHARHEFQQGHYAAGWQDVTSLYKLARHVGNDPLFVGQLVSYAIETMAIEAAAPYLPELKSVLPRGAPAVLDALPARPTLTQLVFKEKRIGALWIIQELKRTEQRKKGSWQDVWKEVFLNPESPEPKLVKSVKSFKPAIKLLEDLLPCYDQLAKLTELPWQEFDAQYPKFIKKAKAANPLAGFVLPAVGKFTVAERRSKTRMALFKAALAVVQGGPDKVKDIKDPFGKGPFKYRPLDKGFQLKSKLILEGKPVTLTVGKGIKE
jgi:hypothetical protein